jgi:hypothetical protein
MMETQDAQPQIEEKPVTPVAETPVAESEKPAETPQETEVKNETEDAAWMKKRMRNLERSLRHAQKKLGSYEERLQSVPQMAHNQSEQDDSEPLSLSRQELERLVQEEARKLAPVLKDQETVEEQRRKVAAGLAEKWGQEGFLERSQNLDAAFGGLVTANKQLKPAVEAIFEADDVGAVIEYLADPDNATEAEAIARMGPIQAGKAIAKLEYKLQAKKATDKPQPSKAAPPIETERGQGTINRAPDPSNTKAWIAWMNEQESKRFR